MRARTMLVILLACWGVLAASAELRVPQDFKTIQEAIAAAAVGDTILVAPGAYVENLTIAKRGLTIRGTDPEQVVVQAKFPDDPVVLVRERDVRLSGLTLTGGRRGIQIDSRAENLSASRLILRGNSGEGFFVEGVRSGELRDSLITQNGTGAFVGSRATFRLQANQIVGNQEGVAALDANRLELLKNIILRNTGCGLKADERSELGGADNVIGQNGQDLCGAAQGRRDLLDQTPPPAPRNLTVAPADWTNQPRFTVDWGNPEDIAGIAAYWFKLGSPPTGPKDGTRREIGQKPLTIENPPEGEQPLFVWLEDGLGNVTHEKRAQVLLRFDKTPPTIRAVLDPKPNANGWNNSEVTVRFQCDDTFSGVASCTPAEIRLTQEGKGQKARAEATDKAGNGAELIVTVNIDRTKPQIAIGSPQGTQGQEGWYRSDVTVPFTATDNLSGFAPDGRLRLEETRRTSGEGDGLKITFAITDLAGNTASAEAGPFKVDKIPPVARIVLDPATPDGREGWYTQAVKVRYECSDGLSGLDPATPCPAERTLTADGTHPLTVTVRDRAGNTATDTKTVKLDRTPPTITASPPDATRWYREDVSVPCTASDATSGLANPADASFTLVARGEGASVSTGTRTVTDRAGNVATAGPFTFQIDKTPPTITAGPSRPPDADGWYNRDVTVNFRCGDPLSDLASCASPVTVTKEGRDQVVPGEAVDKAGNRTTATIKISLDKTPPTGSLTINDGAATTTSTSVTLRISANDNLSGVWQMRFSNDGRTWSDWQSFSSTHTWDLSRFGGSAVSGWKTVYAELRDRAGNTSQTFTMTIQFTFVRTLTGHTRFVTSVAFSPDGKLLASGSYDDTVKLWEVATGREVRTLTAHTNGVLSVAFSPDGRLLASGSDGNTVRLWEVATGSVVRTLTGLTNYVRSVAFSSDGKLLAFAFVDMHGFRITLRDVATGKEVRTSSDYTWWEVNSVAFSPDGRLLASGSLNPQLWDVATMTLIWTGTGNSYSVAFSPDGRLLASGSDGNTVKLWEVATGKVARTLTGHTGWVRSVAFSPDGRLLASGSGYVDKTIKLWDVATGNLVRTLTGHTNDVRSVAFSPDGKLLASGSSDETVKLWDVRLALLAGVAGPAREFTGTITGGDNTMARNGMGDVCPAELLFLVKR